MSSVHCSYIQMALLLLLYFYPMSKIKKKKREQKKKQQRTISSGRDNINQKIHINHISNFFYSILKPYKEELFNTFMLYKCPSILLFPHEISSNTHNSTNVERRNGSVLFLGTNYVLSSCAAPATLFIIGQFCEFKDANRYRSGIILNRNVCMCGMRTIFKYFWWKIPIWKLYARVCFHRSLPFLLSPGILLLLLLLLFLAFCLHRFPCIIYSELSESIK